MASVKTMAFFAVPITVVNFGAEAKELNESLIADAYSEQAMNPIPAGRSAVDGWQSEANLEEKYESFAILRENIKNCIYSILPKYGFVHESTYDELFDCSQLWANILTKHSAYHMPHIHGTGETLLSGVYYPSSGLTSSHEDYFVNEDYEDVEMIASSVPGSGDLVMFDPSAAVKRQVIPTYVQRYPYYGSEICVKPKHSHLVIFPNYLTHMVAPITRDNYERISISFSFKKR